MGDPMTVLFEQLKREADLLQLAGPAHTKHVQDGLREARAAEREAQAQERELKMQNEMKDKELAAMAKLQKEIKQQELESIEKVKAEENRLKKKELDLKERKIEKQTENAQSAAQARTRPKPPYFDDRHDDVESYLFRFEQHAKSVGWKESEWACMLADCLKGKALTYYYELMSSQPDRSYRELVNHLLGRFRCTKEGFREKFRTSKPEETETFPVFFDRIHRYFSRWIDLSEITKDYKSLFDLLITEQFLSSCSTKLVTFLKESSFKDAKDMVQLAERYREVHQDEPMAREAVTHLAHAFVPNPNYNQRANSSPTRTGWGNRGTYYNRGGRGA